MLGLLLLALPELYGVGYPPLEKAIRGHYAIWLLLILLAGKILATSLTIAIGGSGGVFAPSLFMGAMLGSAYGAGVHHFLRGLAAPAGNIRARRHGRRVRCRRAGADHCGDHHLRAHRRLSDHPAAHVRVVLAAAVSNLLSATPSTRLNCDGAESTSSAAGAPT